MNTYQLWNIYDPLFKEPDIIKGKTMADAIEKFMGDKLKPNEKIKQTKNSGNFVISKYPVKSTTKRYTFGIFVVY